MLPKGRDKGSKGGGDRVRLPDVDTSRLSGLKYKLICHFKLASDMSASVTNPNIYVKHKRKLNKTMFK